MPKVSENAEGSFKLLNGEKIYLQRNEEGECYAFLNTIGTAYRNGTYAIGRKIVEGFRPMHNVLISCAVLKNSQILPNTKLDFIILTSGNVLVNAVNMPAAGTKIELVGHTTYLVSPEDWHL